MRDNEARGSIFGLRKRYIEQHLGAQELARFAERLAPDVRALLLEPPFATAWVPFGALMDVDVALIRGPFRGDPARMGPLSDWGARQDVPSVFKFFLRLGSPSFVMKRLGVAFSSKMKKGTLREENLERTSTEIVLASVLMPLYYCTHAMPAWAMCALGLTGAKDIVVHHVECRHRGAEVCRWTARWR